MVSRAMANRMTQPETESFPTLDDMSDGLKGMADRIRDSVPRLASLDLPRSQGSRPEHIARAAEELHEVTSSLEPLWPSEDEPS